MLPQVLGRIEHFLIRYQVERGRTPPLLPPQPPPQGRIGCAAFRGYPRIQAEGFRRPLA